MSESQRSTTRNLAFRVGVQGYQATLSKNSLLRFVQLTRQPYQLAATTSHVPHLAAVIWNVLYRHTAVPVSTVIGMLHTWLMTNKGLFTLVTARRAPTQHAGRAADPHSDVSRLTLSGASRPGGGAVPVVAVVGTK